MRWQQQMWRRCGWAWTKSTSATTATATTATTMMVMPLTVLAVPQRIKHKQIHEERAAENLDDAVHEPAFQIKFTGRLIHDLVEASHKRSPAEQAQPAAAPVAGAGVGGISLGFVPISQSTSTSSSPSPASTPAPTPAPTPVSTSASASSSDAVAAGAADAAHVAAGKDTNNYKSCFEEGRKFGHLEALAERQEHEARLEKEREAQLLLQRQRELLLENDQLKQLDRSLKSLETQQTRAPHKVNLCEKETAMVLKCYRASLAEPLKCAVPVNDYAKCAERVKLAAFTSLQ